MPTHEQISQEINIAENLILTFNQEDLESSKAQLEEKLSAPGIWDDPKTATKINQDLSKIQNTLDQISTLKTLIENLNIAFELKEENEANIILSQIQDICVSIENAQFLSGPLDSANVVMNIHAGAGGLDAQDWAAMLASMYQAFARRQNWKAEVVNISPGEEGGVKNISIRIEGETVYGLLKEEFGVHRLVRLSPFNSGHTRETSFALVEVLPAGLDSHINIDLDEKDLRWDYFMASGKGGQSVNTTYSAVRLVHIPSNISISSQNQRSQQQNKQQALETLRDRLAVLELKKQKEYINEIKGDFVSAQWGSQIRSYVLHPYKLVKDLRSGWETTDTMAVLESGDILPIILSVKRLES